MPVPTPSGHIFDGTVTAGKTDSTGEADARREQMVKGVDSSGDRARSDHFTIAW